MRAALTLSLLLVLAAVGPATADDPSPLKPFELQTNSALLRGGITDTMGGALLKTTQSMQRAKSGGRFFSPKYQILQPRVAPDLSGALKQRASVEMPDLVLQSGSGIELPPLAAKLVGNLDLDKGKADLDLVEQKPATADLDIAPVGRSPELALAGAVDTGDLQTRMKDGPELAVRAQAAPELTPLKSQEPVTQLAERSVQVADLVIGGRTNGDLAIREKPKSELPDLALGNQKVVDLQPVARATEDLSTTRVAANLEIPKPKPVDLPVEPKHAVAAVMPTVAKVRERHTSDASQRESEVSAKLQKRPKPAPSEKPAKAPRQEILWAEWYERVGKLCDARVIKELAERDNPKGWCIVRLTVRSDGTAGVERVDGDGNDFIDATVQAYSSIDGSPELAFPAGSRRKEVSFQVTNKQAEEGPVVEVDSKRISNDREVIGK